MSDGESLDRGGLERSHGAIGDVLFRIILAECREEAVDGALCRYDSDSCRGNPLTLEVHSSNVRERNACRSENRQC